MAGSVLIRCDASDLGRLGPRADGWGDTLRGELRSEFGAVARAAGRRASENALRSRFPASRPAARSWPTGSTGLRAALAASVNVTVRDAGDAVEARISSRHPLALQTNGSKRWQHPVFGDRETWRGQEGSHWWSDAMDTSRPLMRQAARRALSQAVEQF